jgi:hypothetical protein
MIEIVRAGSIGIDIDKKSWKEVFFNFSAFFVSFLGGV